MFRVWFRMVVWGERMVCGDRVRYRLPPELGLRIWVLGCFGFSAAAPAAGGRWWVRMIDNKGLAWYVRGSGLRSEPV